MGMLCVICKSNVDPKSSYRKFAAISCEFSSILTELKIDGNEISDGYVCRFCVSKCKRILKIDVDLENVTDKLKQNRRCLISELIGSEQRSSYEKVRGPKTPIKKPCKRKLNLTPKTPKTLRLSTSSTQTDPGKTDRNQRELSFTNDSDVQILVNYEDRLKSSRVRDPSLQAICRAIANGRTFDQITRLICRQTPFESLLRNNFVKSLEKECQSLTSQTNALHSVSASDLEKLSFRSVEKEWSEKTKLLAPVLRAISNDHAETLSTPVVFAGASLLRQRCPKLSQLHQATGLVLDDGGATDETISIFHKLGVCVSPTTIYRKKSALVEYHEHIITTKFQNHVKIIGNENTASASHPCSAYNFTTDLECWNLRESDSIDHELLLTPVTPAQPLTSTLSQVSFLDGCCLPDHDFDQENLLCPRILCSTPNVKNQSSPINKEQKKCVPFEIIGDNFDINIAPNQMTKSCQKKSLHWFMYCAVNKRVHADHLPDDGPQMDIAVAPSTVYVPSFQDNTSLENDFVYFIAQALTSKLAFLKKFMSLLPPFLDHKHMEEMKKKSEFVLCELIDKSENESEGMISILDTIQRKFVPRSNEEIPRVVEKVVFGGDCLTNERAYSGQQAMSNGDSDYECFGGFIHRPEGFHRIMNYVLMLYQIFYTQSSERGTLWQLRNIINRRDVSGSDSVTNKFRPHHQFIEDSLDAHLLALGRNYFGISEEDTDGNSPTCNAPPTLLATDSQKMDWLFSHCRQMMCLINQGCNSGVFLDLNEELHKMDEDYSLVEDMKDNMSYQCQYCQKNFLKKKSFIKHLEKAHGKNFFQPGQHETITKTNTASNFTYLALLLRSSYQALKYGDGQRLFRNAKFEHLLAGVCGHTKYRLWLWRYLAYGSVILSPKQATEYIWNVTTNMTGGVGCNIANDNMVEVMVKTVKKKLKAQGANVTIRSAQTACKTTTLIDKIVENIQKEASCRMKSGKHTRRSRDDDITAMALELVNCRLNVFQQENDFLSPMCRISTSEQFTWVEKQRKRASIEMFF